MEEPFRGVQRMVWNARHMKHNEKKFIVFQYIGPHKTKRYRLMISDEGICLNLIKEEDIEECHPLQRVSL